MDRENASIVAVIDDDDEVRDVLRTLLETAGHDVETFKSGIHFLQHAELERMGCLVVDQRMPRMTGLELLLELERRGRPIPALLITGVHDPEIDAAASTIGAMTVLEKPMSPQKLLRFVEFTLG
ncbi:MAG TPA: response regulator [Acetobacteraceae bacterium]|nr:response regulator [Acetobacteraceae bacterium]